MEEIQKLSEELREKETQFDGFKLEYQQEIKDYQGELESLQQELDIKTQTINN